MLAKYGSENEASHVGNTRDTLCYATKNNQTATQFLLNTPADLAIVIGGRNSSNTSHLVELCEYKLPTYFIQSEADILSQTQILHFDFHHHTEHTIQDFLPHKEGIEIILTSGASCPDSLLEKVMMKILSFYSNVRSLEEVIADFSQHYA
jgi:4-hydroxy-3-methylbut-2-enyl diphosphate reductase